VRFASLPLERYMRAETHRPECNGKTERRGAPHAPTPGADPSGCTEPVILAHGFTLDRIANLVFRGFAKREVNNVTIGGRQVKIVRMQITTAGLKEIAD
jgi:hypothetical protein